MVSESKIVSRAVIRDEAGNMGYATNTVVYTVVTNAVFLHNAAGCITNISHTGTDGYSDSMDLEWDERYRLTSVSADDASSFVAYEYDVLNRRTSRTAGDWDEEDQSSPATVEWYVYNGNQVAADLDASGNLLRTYVWGMGIDNLLSFTDHTSLITYYLIKDHQNTVLALVDGAGSVVETYEYDAYGRTKVYDASGTELPMSGTGNRYTFQGREIDWSTGLIYFRARWFNPETGRWLSKDPIGISGGLNLYEFCGSNPVNYIDPYGEARKTPVDVGEGYTSAIDHGSGQSPHQHIYKNGKEVAKVNKNGGYMKIHNGKALLKPSRLPPSVRNNINKLVRVTRFLATKGASVIMIVFTATDIGADPMPPLFFDLTLKPE